MLQNEIVQIVLQKSNFFRSQDYFYKIFQNPQKMKLVFKYLSLYLNQMNLPVISRITKFYDFAVTREVLLKQ